MYQQFSSVESGEQQWWQHLAESQASALAPVGRKDQQEYQKFLQISMKMWDLQALHSQVYQQAKLWLYLSLES